jgi:hypothetical protein
MDLPETEELTECPYQDEELSRDSYLSPAFSSHGDILAGRATLGDKSPLRSQVTGFPTYQELAANRGKFGYVMFVGFALWEH